jgi:hypothetical protein
MFSSIISIDRSVRKIKTNRIIINWEIFLAQGNINESLDIANALSNSALQ